MRLEQEEKLRKEKEEQEKAEREEKLGEEVISVQERSLENLKNNSVSGIEFSWCW